MSAPKRNEPRIGAASAGVFLRSYCNPIRNLTPQRLVTAMDQFEAGDLGNLARIMERIEQRDDKIMVVAPKRKKAVARYGWDVLTVDFDKKDKRLVALAERQVEALKFFYNNLTAQSVTEQNRKGGMKLLVRQMMDAVGKRYSVHEIQWKKQGKYYTANFWHCPLSFFEATTGTLRFLPSATSVQSEEMLPGEWMVTVGDGVMIPCSICYLFKSKPRNALIRFCEKFGLPGIHAETDATPGSKEWKEMVSAVRNFINDWSVVTTAGTKFNLVEAKGGTGNLPHTALIEDMNRAMVMLWRGADLGTMSKGGDTSGASLQGDETDVLEQDDAEWITETLNISVDRPLIDITFGEDAPSLAYVSILTKDRQNVDQELKVDQFLHSLNFPISLQGLSERYGRPIPDDDEELIGAKESVQDPNKQPDPEEDPVKAANERRGKVVGKVSDLLGVPEAWLSPLEKLLAEIEAKFTDGNVSEEELRTWLLQTQRDLNELLGPMDVPALAGLFEAAMGEASVSGLKDGLKNIANTQK